MFRNLKIRYKILFIAILATFSYLSIWVAVQLLGERSSVLMYEIETEYQPSLQMSRDLEICIIRIDHAFKDAVAQADLRALEKIEKLKNRFSQLLDDTRFFSTTERVERLRRDFEGYYALAHAYAEQRLTGDVGRTLAASPDSIHHRFESIKEMLNSDIELDRQKVATAFELARQNHSTSLEVITLVTVFCIISLGVLSLLIARSFTKPLEEVVQVANWFARGNRHVRVSVDSQDEVGVLAKTFNQMIEDIRKITVSRDYVDNIFRSLNDALFVISRDGKIETVNAAACTMLGYTESEFMKMEVRDILADSRFNIVDLVGSRHSISNIEQEYTSKKGRKIPVLFSAAAMDMGSEEGYRIVCAARDMTDLIKTEEAMRESELRFRNIVESSPMGLFMFELCDDDYLVLAGSNPAATVLFGDENPLRPGQRIEDAFEVLQDEQLFAQYRRVAKDGKASHEERAVVLVNGETKHFDIHAFQTSPGKLVTAFLDITQRKNAQKEKQRLEAQLRQSQKMEAIGTLAGGIAHDFNNILWIIMGNAELALRRVRTTDPAHCKLNEILVASRRAKSLIEKILTFSRRNDYEQKSIRIDEVVTEALNLLEATLPSTIRIQRDIRNCGTLIADPTQIHQMVVNLCTNSYQAIGDQQGILEVFARPVTLDEKSLASVPELSPGDYVEVLVADNGCGMTKETLERIFDPFFTTKDVGKGTGLGLATVHGIVSDMGGLIKVDSQRGQGSTFRILLPKQKDSRKAEAPESEQTASRSRNIIVVDEEAEANSGRRYS